MPDLSRKQRKRETEIALAVADAFQTNITSVYTAPQELLAHHFGLVCKRFDFVPTEESAKRIFATVWAEISERRWKAEQLAETTRVPD
jgi:hypothetical protein